MNPKLEKALEEAQVPLWFWNDKLEEMELIRQLELKTQVGVTCTNPHARTNEGEGYIGGYLDEQWMKNIETVLNYKKANDEKMWLYDEIDWPAGTCDKTITKDENNREKYITVEVVKIPKGQKFRAQLQTFEGDSIEVATGEINASEMSFNINIENAKTGRRYDIGDYLTDEMFGPELEFVADEDATAYITKLRVDAYELGGNLQSNYLDADVTKKHLESTHEKYYRSYCSFR